MEKSIIFAPIKQRLKKVAVQIELESGRKLNLTTNPTPGDTSKTICNVEMKLTEDWYANLKNINLNFDIKRENLENGK